MKIKGSTIIKLIMWLVMTFAMSAGVSELLEINNSITNILGILIFYIYLIISWKTDCFTKL